MKIVIIDENSKKKKVNTWVEWLIYMVGYSLVLIMSSLLFNETFYINNKYFGLFSLIAAIIIYLLNKTIKPILVVLTLPITGLTLGLFYPFINVFILYMTSFILGDNFIINGGLFMLFVLALFISFMNIVIEGFFIKPIIEKRKHEIR